MMELSTVLASVSIMVSKQPACNPQHVCTLELQNAYSFCKLSGMGSLVFCGSDQKPAYMAVYDRNIPVSRSCLTSFQAYHIPLLLQGNMNMA